MLKGVSRLESINETETNTKKMIVLRSLLTRMNNHI